MKQPLVAAILLTADRKKMTDRAVRSFRSQTYVNKCLVVWDNGVYPYFPELMHSREFFWFGVRGSIGRMRNNAIRFALDAPTPAPEIICHWDDDDWSHPRRIEEQVALLQSSGAECVGYNELLFWREPRRKPDDHQLDAYPHGSDDTCFYDPDNRCGGGEVLHYSNADKRYCPGTSLMYWRSTWERRPFANLPTSPTSSGEDWEFQRELKRTCVSSLEGLVRICNKCGFVGHAVGHAGCNYHAYAVDQEPRMIATIHGGNTCDYSTLSPCNWARVPEWDARVRKIMEEA